MNVTKQIKSKHRVTEFGEVNTSFQTIENIILSAGGVGPTPLLLDKTSKLLKDSNLRFNQNSLITALSHDISPISDLRGTANYRSAAMVGLIKKMQRSAISGEKQHSIMSI